MDVDLLVGAGEITRRLGLKRIQQVHYFHRSDPMFPKPVFRIAEARGGAYVWYWPDIERWVKTRGPLPGAVPPKGP